MTKRERAIWNAGVAGYHEDSAAFTRLIVESRVARPFMNEAWREGQAAKAAGMGCKCFFCTRPVEERRHITPEPRGVLALWTAEQELL